MFSDTRVTPQTRIRCITWNIGGASSAAWQVTWATDNQGHYDLIFVQETHWQYDGIRVFRSEEWTVFSSGASRTNVGASPSVCMIA